MQPVKMIAVQRYIGEEGHVRVGQVLTVTPRRAEQLRASGLATDAEGGALKKSAPPVSGAGIPSASSPEARALPQQTPATLPTEDGERSQSMTPIVSPPGATSSTPVTGDGGTPTPTKRGRGRPPKVRA